ncbi:unnamed protein product [Ceutorhynchus assimilis]|uniref:Uncharacterized protein n=1 Tax=Ceutorhynchus assimilis TaxID=467358 RepID=A0A9N9QI89_9CUCU|nr:unnamed protein product [Ceutorhynchus assimilis]
MLILFLFFSLIFSAQAINIQTQYKDPNNKPPSPEHTDLSKEINSTNNKNPPIIVLDPIKDRKINANVTSSTPILNQTANNIPAPNLPKINETLEEKTIDIGPGPVARGIIVFVGLALLFICYVGMKTYRRRKQDKSKIMVRKYGVRARRTDVEMEPLSLSDEEEDETVFDLAANSFYLLICCCD